MSTEKRPYRSPLRAARAAQTQERILDAAMELLGDGASALTIPAVAKRAGVAVPTVYRYFPSKDVLEDAVAEHARQLLGVGRRQVQGIDSMIAASRANWMAAAELPPAALTVLLSSITRNLDQAEAQTHRRAYVEKALDADLAGVSPQDRAHFVTLVQALSSSVGHVAYRRTGLDPEQSGDELEWLLTTLHQALVDRGS